MTTVGTASGSILASLPATAAAARFLGSSIVVASGTMGFSLIPTGSTKVAVAKYDNTTFWVNGNVIVIGITYEVP